ncbi:MAG: hypothetical protein Kow0089_23800 [Desulfobulbaceae bacterium]
MTRIPDTGTLRGCLDALGATSLSPLDVLGEGSLEEKLVALALNGPPEWERGVQAALYRETLARLGEIPTENVRVVTLGGGTGLSNIIGGDSRRDDWRDHPFTGLKEIFPRINSIVCVTDDGGSTGELLKFLPLIGLGDLRHVLVSSIRRDGLQQLYNLDYRAAYSLTGKLHAVFNHRFETSFASPEELCAAAGITADFPAPLYDALCRLIRLLFSNPLLKRTLSRPQCLGNLLLAAAVMEQEGTGRSVDELLRDQARMERATIDGLRVISRMLGIREDAVLPCTTTPAQLQVLYGNGILVTGENKSGHARRGYPVDRAIVRFCGEPVLPPETERVIDEADIIICAPGSLFTSIIPILQVPGVAERIRNNSRALKILVSNIWVQKGETDATRDDPGRKYHVSDLVRAYDRNIPGGVEGLFSHILTLHLGEIPGSVLQNYALEDKEPIYVDRDRLREIGYAAVEAGIYSTDKLRRRNVIQHDPDALATAVATLWRLHSEQEKGGGSSPRVRPSLPRADIALPRDFVHPCLRFVAHERWLDRLEVQRANEDGSPVDLGEPERTRLLDAVAETLWYHADILPEHLEFARGIILVPADRWSRCQEWDNVFSFYDPDESVIVIREDQTGDPRRFVVAFLVALGQSLLGDYAMNKTMEEVRSGEGEVVGRLYRLTVRSEGEFTSFFSRRELDRYLRLARMCPSDSRPELYTRLVNGDEGFTPPGLLFGLFFAWYLDNRLAGHIEYKMSIMRDMVSDLIPEQEKIVRRRTGLIDFFRETVFRHPLSTGRQ